MSVKAYFAQKLTVIHCAPRFRTDWVSLLIRVGLAAARDLTSLDAI